LLLALLEPVVLAVQGLEQVQALEQVQVPGPLPLSLLVPQASFPVLTDSRPTQTRKRRASALQEQTQIPFS
jgi:hypothetical protein